MDCIAAPLADGNVIGIPIADILSVVDEPVHPVPPCVGRGIAGTVAVDDGAGGHIRVPVIRLGGSTGPCVILRCPGGAWAVQVAKTGRTTRVRPTGGQAGDWFAAGDHDGGRLDILDATALSASFTAVPR